MVKLRNLFLCFLFYGFLGWVYEVLLGICEARMGFRNRGFMFGPYLPVYGFGALLIIGLIRKIGILPKTIPLLKTDIRPVTVFFGIVVLATMVELLTSYLMEAVMGRWLWDYHTYAFNFEGRIALKSSLRFGVGGMAVVYLLQPALVKVLSNQSKNVQKAINLAAVVLAVLFAIDLLFRFRYGSNYQERIV